ncbi:hypothetical protein HK100_001092 [Physocladia obscura]|uniref:Uncharacterized protein n=1 Tax=Physocladia obscura TaxID=109957 RepID=A0AAD5SXA6_9FUNG|nr:hypothetical protein HK100_001092 [Physocladia obscura]
MKSLQTAKEINNARPNFEVLERISKLYTLAISLNLEAKLLKNAVLDEMLHLNLGLIFEEIACCEEIFPVQIQIEKSFTTKANDNESASASFMNDEVEGLLMGLGVAKNASDVSKIKAMEEEYHRLLSAGMSDQAAEVQGLHQWKVQQVNASCETEKRYKTNEFINSSENGNTANALLKYEDALAINPTSAIVNYHLGRVYLQFGNFEKAQLYFEYALSNKPVFPQAKLLLAIAIVSINNTISNKISHVIKILEDATSNILFELWKNSSKDVPEKICESVTNITHRLFPTIFIALSKAYLYFALPSKASDPILDLLHILSTNYPKLRKNSKIQHNFTLSICMARKQLLHAQSFVPATSLDYSRSRILDIANRATITPAAIILCKRSSNENSMGTVDALSVFESVCEAMLFQSPRGDSSTLSELGRAQFNQFEYNPKFSNRLIKLSNAIECFEAAIRKKPDEDTVGKVEQQEWYVTLKREMAAFASNSTVKEMKPIGNSNIGRTGTKKIIVTTKKDIAKPGTTKQVPLMNKTVEKKGSGFEKAVPPKAQGKDANAAAMKKISESTTKLLNSTPKVSTVSLSTKKDEHSIPKEVTGNEVLFDVYIGLARALSRKLGFIEESNPKDTQISELLHSIISYYKTAIAIKPDLHDGYIELGTILERKVSIRAAADLYCTFPFQPVNNTANFSQDDVYLFAELGRCFMKEKRYKEKLLISCLIAEGRATGMSCLSKYVEALDSAGESKILMALYAGVNKKSIDDPDLLPFFKSKFWL